MKGIGVIALVHHANQFLITDGYDNREGVSQIVGCSESRIGLWRVVEAHRARRVPLNLHVSGTLLEAVAWQRPEFLDYLKEVHAEGWVEFVGSCYGQNIMRFFSYEYNLKQINEELRLFQCHLGIDPHEVRTFWPPERVWDTDRIAPVLRDSRLLNGGYDHVLVDDRVLLPANGERQRHDRERKRDAKLFRQHRIRKGGGLTALPIATGVRLSVPPASPQDWRTIDETLSWLAAQNSGRADHIAVYADDMEKAAGVGWDPAGPERYESLLDQLTADRAVAAVKLSEWAASTPVRETRDLEQGTFHELATEFQAGENYERWFLDERWAPYRGYFEWAADRVAHLDWLGANPALIRLARKHLLASAWETGWHTPATGAHGAAGSNGGPSPWAKALTSHSRHAAVIAEAAYWMNHRDEEAHAYLADIDHDDEQELIIKNDQLFAVLTPRWGGRLIYLFSIEGQRGTMVVGNPTDDWNFLETLNQCMRTPRNHPGALADRGYEDDRYAVSIRAGQGEHIKVALENREPGSAGSGLRKEISLSYGYPALRVEYVLPSTVPPVNVEFGLSPDYLSLLRGGRSLLQDYSAGGSRGLTCGRTSVWLEPDDSSTVSWTGIPERDFGHGRSFELTGVGRFACWLGVEVQSLRTRRPRTRKTDHRKEATSWQPR